MEVNKKKISNINLLIIFFLILFLSSFIAINKFKKKNDKALALKTISINLLTSVHNNLSWNFKPIEPKLIVKTGEVKTVEYIVENLGDKETTGIATFSYYPKAFGNYINKINCFCYDAQTLKPRQKGKYTLVIFIDPEVTKDSKTKNIKEVTIQFTFFDYKEYQKNKS